MKIKKLLTIGILGILIVVVNLGCNRTTTKKTLNYGDDLKDAIETFENGRQKVSQSITESVENTSSQLVDKKSDLPDVTEEWEIQWNDINKKFNKLEDDFSKVGIESEEYFKKLNELSSGIKKEHLRNAELKRNKEVKEKWTAAYVEASNNMKKIREVISESEDVYRMLAASSLRQKIEANITELETISSRAKTLMIELEKFTIEGKKLIS